MDEREAFKVDEILGIDTGPSMNEIEGKTPLAWNDKHLELFPGVKYEQITDNELLRRIGENWFIMLYQSKSVWLPELTVLLALHLRGLGDRNILCDPKDQDDNISDQKQDLTFLVNEITLRKIEDITGRKDADQGTSERGGPGSLVIEGVTEAEAAKLYKLITKLRKMPTWYGCAFYSFFATIALRVIIKDENKVAEIFSSSAIKKIHKFYGLFTFVVVPKPQVTAFKIIKSQISSKVKGPLYVGLLKAFLKAATREKGSPSRGILDYTLLVHTKMNGLHLYDLLIKATNNACLKLNHVYKESYCKETAAGILLLTAFIIKYYCVPLEEQQEYVLWSRLFDDAYFCNMRVAKHSILAAFLITIANVDENDPTWNMPGLKISRRRKKKFISAGIIWQAQRMAQFDIELIQNFEMFHHRQSKSSNPDQAQKTLASILQMTGHL